MLGATQPAVRKLASTIAKWSAVLGMAEHAERFAEERIEIESWLPC
jgi:hypothetical protein